MSARARNRARDRARDGLATYNAKRDFAVTPEPAGKPSRPSARSARQKGGRFVVQKHDATRLHWDFRLEMDGVLKSWAVTRGPSTDPEERRLAVRTEDHPLDYGRFEGVIPEAEYGGGTVMLWDRGTWEPVEGHPASLEKGLLHLRLKGERMKGEWLLVRLRPREGERGENWLLRKLADDHAAPGDALVATALTSVSTGRTLPEIAQGATSRRRTRKRKALPLSLPTPAFRPPMLATLAQRVPQGEAWWFEVKCDGYRCLLGLGKDGVRAWTRSGIDWAERYGDIAEAAARLPCGSALIDGEVIALDGGGRPDFSLLQRELKSARPRLVFMAFDLLEIDGEDLRALPLSARKPRLATLMADAPEPLRLLAHATQDGEALFAALRDDGYEGIIAKRADAPYRHARSPAWLKIKAGRREEFVIVGWEPSERDGRAFRSLLLAQHQGGKLVYKGKVGTGFDTAEMVSLAERLGALHVPRKPFAGPANGALRPRWVRAVLVAEVRYAEMTAEGRLRQASFIALREDKPAMEVEPETAPARLDLPDSPASFIITNARRRIFGQGGPTKGQLAAWYEAVAPLLLEELRDRPLSLVRCPQGIANRCFFQKHLKEGWGDELVQHAIANAGGEEDTVFTLRDAAGLLRCVQMGTIEFHGWGARANRIERPDRLVFDLDPAPDVDFAAVVDGARLVRDRLADMGLATAVMTTGGKGLHVVARLNASARWDKVEDFAHRFALALERMEPDRFTAALSKARRKGRIFVDWLRNQRGSTAVMPWSVRARAGAPVAVPLAWDELAGMEAANRYALSDPAEVLARARDADPGWAGPAQPLPDP